MRIKQMKRMHILAILSAVGFLLLSPRLAQAAEGNLDPASQSGTPQDSIEPNSQPPVLMPRAGVEEAPPTAIPRAGGDVVPTDVNTQYDTYRAGEAERQANTRAELQRQRNQEARDQAKAELQRQQEQEAARLQDQAELQRQQEQEAARLQDQAEEESADALLIAQVPDVSANQPKSEPAVIEKVVKRVELKEVSFLCNEDSSSPATVVKLKDQSDLVVILWKSDFFKTAGYDAQTRCKQVSARFEAYNKNKSITYLTTGSLHGQSVICLTSKKDGGCGDGISLSQGLLFTLKPSDSSDEAVESLVAALQNQNATPLEQ
jgi:Circadian oscillating protein COP23